MTTYSTVTAGIVGRLNTVPDMVDRVLDYEPTTIEPPMTYLLLDSYTRSVAGQKSIITYRTLARTCIRWLDNEQAEIELRAYVNSIPAAMEADPSLGSRVTDGPGAFVTGATAVFVVIGGTLYRALDTVIETTTKPSFGSGQ